MLTKEVNDLLTRIGPGTPAGDLFRRYWQPFAGEAELQGRGTMKVRLLGEDLALFRDGTGNLGLVAELCPHRRCSLVYGVPEDAGIRCPYHGWLFDREGRCLEQPPEPPTSTFKDRVRTTAYPVRSMGGLLWAYMGPGEPPLLPRHDYFVQPNMLRQIGKTELPINWLQAMENSLDPHHSEWLHSWYGHYHATGRTRREDGLMPQARHAKIGFDVFDRGIVKRRYYEGGSEGDNDWKIGHPIIFPNMLKVQNTFQIRVPVDDENMIHFLYTATSYPDVEAPHQDIVPVYEFPYREENGDLAVRHILQQDMMAWVTQGRIADRTVEHLGSSDRGILLYRKVLREMIRKVQEGEDPLGVYRDPSDDQVIEVPVDSMLPALTPTSVRGANRVIINNNTGYRQDETELEFAEIERQMRIGQYCMSPVLDEMIEMRRQHIRNRQRRLQGEPVGE